MSVKLAQMCQAEELAASKAAEKMWLPSGSRQAWSEIGARIGVRLRLLKEAGGKGDVATI